MGGLFKHLHITRLISLQTVSLLHPIMLQQHGMETLSHAPPSQRKTWSTIRAYQSLITLMDLQPLLANTNKLEMPSTRLISPMTHMTHSLNAFTLLIHEETIIKDDHTSRTISHCCCPHAPNLIPLSLTPPSSQTALLASTLSTCGNRKPLYRMKTPPPSKPTST